MRVFFNQVGYLGRPSCQARKLYYICSGGCEYSALLYSLSSFCVCSLSGLHEHEDIDQFVAKLTCNIQTAHNAARTQLKTTLKRMKRDYDLRGVVKRNYQAKDIVYLLDTAVLKGNCRKLSSTWKGPAIVIERLSAALFRVQLRKSRFRQITTH